MLRLMHPQKQAAACLSFAYHFFAPLSKRLFIHIFFACGQSYPDRTPLRGNGSSNKKFTKHGSFILMPKNRFCTQMRQDR